MNEINKRKAAETTTTITTRRVEPSDNISNHHDWERCRNRFYAFIGVVVIIIIIVLICTGDIDLSNIEWDDDDDDYYYDDDDDDW